MSLGLASRLRSLMSIMLLIARTVQMSLLTYEEREA